MARHALFCHLMAFVFPAWNIGIAFCFVSYLLLNSFFNNPLSLPSHVLSEKGSWAFVSILTLAFAFVLAGFVIRGFFAFQNPDVMVSVQR